jgi:hypothetical protein
MKNTALIICLLILVVIVCTSPAALAQSEPESGNGTLYIQSQTGGRDVEVPVGSSVNVRYRHNPIKYRSVPLQAVFDSSVVLGPDTVGIQFIDEIGVRREKLHKAGSKVFWASVIIIAVWIAFAVIATLIAISAPAPIYALFSVLSILSIPAGLAFPIGLIVGITLLATSVKKYSLYHDYKLSTTAREKPPTK